MKLLGDVSQENKELAEKLTKFESELDSDPYMSTERKAQCFVCLAHDYLQIDLDEEGHRLLAKAETTHPGYFREVIGEHVDEDYHYDTVIRNIGIELLYLMAENLQNKK